jgi:hypothetical protein
VFSRKVIHWQNVADCNVAGMSHPKGQIRHL